MERVYAIYARKSVERADSISIESQIEFCKYETRGGDYKIYSDNGFSGKNTARPAFNEMMKDIRSGRISSVIVYKLDRISRSILDFSSMMELFRQYGVSFISATEKFDTSSPMGRAMLNICIVFAQLERETIQQRVTDAYSARSKKGFFMGGTIPYGFTKAPVVIHGVHTSKYVRLDSEAEDVRMIYEMYSSPVTTLGDVLRKLPHYNKRGKLWTTAKLSSLIRNPAYCKADHSVYEFFRSQGANLYSSPEDFRGINGLYMFKGSNPNRKTWDLSGREIVVAPHEGLVEPDLWLICRRKILDNHLVRASKPKNSWLCGVIKCAHCGYAAVIKRAKNHEKRYFVCSCAMSTGTCNGIGRTVYASELEQEIKKEIENKISSISSAHKEKKPVSNTMTDCMSVWDIMSFDDKRAVVKILIKKLCIDSTGYSIEWSV